MVRPRRQQKIKTRELHIEKLVFGGQALARDEGKVILVWNALPGEEVYCEIFRRKKSFEEGVAKKILKESDERIAPEESHYLSCSPWQIMSYSAEDYWKSQIARDVFSRSDWIDQLWQGTIVSEKKEFYGYRNKLEYSFTADVDRSLQLAFYGRGSHRRLAIEPCFLGQVVLNETAVAVRDWLARYRFPLRSLKSCIVRSDSMGRSICALFVKDRMSFLRKPELPEHCSSLSIYYSDHRSPASRPDELLFREGEPELMFSLGNKTLKCGLTGFFQINVPQFMNVFRDMETFVDTGSCLIDLYAGVGSIGVYLSDKAKKTVIVEVDEDSARFAERNIADNHIEYATVIHAPAEKALSCIEKDAVIIVDPPRSGMHPKLLARLLEIKPKRILYLSCNMSTQCRDVDLLCEAFTPVYFNMYNFFPRTPHAESLCVLDRLS